MLHQLNEAVSALFSALSSPTHNPVGLQPFVVQIIQALLLFVRLFTHILVDGTDETLAQAASLPCTALLELLGIALIRFNTTFAPAILQDLTVIECLDRIVKKTVGCRVQSGKTRSVAGSSAKDTPSTLSFQPSTKSSDHFLADPIYKSRILVPALGVLDGLMWLPHADLSPA